MDPKSLLQRLQLSKELTTESSSKLLGPGDSNLLLAQHRSGLLGLVSKLESSAFKSLAESNTLTSTHMLDNGRRFHVGTNLQANETTIFTDEDMPNISVVASPVRP